MMRRRRRWYLASAWIPSKVIVIGHIQLLRSGKIDMLGLLILLMLLLLLLRLLGRLSWLVMVVAMMNVRSLRGHVASCWGSRRDTNTIHTWGLAVKRGSVIARAWGHSFIVLRGIRYGAWTIKTYLLGMIQKVRESSLLPHVLIHCLISTSRSRPLSRRCRMPPLLPIALFPTSSYILRRWLLILRCRRSPRSLLLTLPHRRRPLRYGSCILWAAAVSILLLLLIRDSRLNLLLLFRGALEGRVGSLEDHTAVSLRAVAFRGMRTRRRGGGAGVRKMERLGWA